MNKRQIVNYPPPSLPWNELETSAIQPPFNRRERILWSKRVKEKEDKTNQIKRVEKIGEKKRKKNRWKITTYGRYACSHCVVSIGSIAARATLISLVLVKLPSTHYAHEIAVVFIAAVVSCRLDARWKIISRHCNLPVNTHPFHDFVSFFFLTFTRKKQLFPPSNLSTIIISIQRPVNNANVVTAGHTHRYCNEQPGQQVNRPIDENERA